MKCIEGYGQYKDDFFNKLGFEFEEGKSLLDVGSGDATDLRVFINEYSLDARGIDIYKHEDVDNLGMKFDVASILDIPFPDSAFDYVYSHDVLHHVDEKHQRRRDHVGGLVEMKRVTKNGGYTIIVEGNRYNPLFYPHVVKMMGHEHFRQSYFKSIVGDVFEHVEFRTFEAHLYPEWGLRFFKLYEGLMERYMPHWFMAYNVAIALKLRKPIYS